MNPGVIAAIIGAGASGVSAATQGGPKRQYKWNKRAAEDANRMNRENQQWLLEQQLAIQKEQREYDTPAKQMERYLAAGLNPHLIYGNGSSAGNVFPANVPGLPGVGIAPPDASYPDVSGAFLSAAQGVTQMQLAQARTSESYTNQALKEIQTDIAKANPMLDPRVYEWVVASTEETAKLKALESRQWMSGTAGGTKPMKFAQKINAEVEALVQRLGLNTTDLAIRNRILESKEFENAVKKIQADWLKDGDISPEHIRQGLMLLLQKMLP